LASLLDKAGEIHSKLIIDKRILDQAQDFPAVAPCLVQACHGGINSAGKQKGNLLYMKVKGREILIYCFLAYLFSWTYWLTGMLGRNPVHPFNSLGGYGISVGMFGPMLAAIIMRAFISREGFKGSVGVIRPFKFYVIAYLVPFFFILALIMFNNITGIGRFEWTGSTPLFTSILITAGKVFLLLPVSFGEEYGWRGYLLPRLLPLGEIKGTVILGLIWACWHLPPLTLAHDSLWLSIPVFLAGAILVTFPFTWLYRASGASVLVVSLFHSSYDIWGDNFTTAETYPGQTQLLVGDTGLICISFLLVIVVLKYIVFGVRCRFKT
jgi:membrane protease YdiL (CAAX protease family)